MRASNRRAHTKEVSDTPLAPSLSRSQQIRIGTNRCAQSRAFRAPRPAACSLSLAAQNEIGI